MEIKALKTASKVSWVQNVLIKVLLNGVHMHLLASSEGSGIAIVKVVNIITWFLLSCKIYIVLVKKLLLC